jgi:hypothetical protein
VATDTAGGATGNWRGVTISSDGLRFVVGDAGQTAGGGGQFRNFPSGTTEDLKAVTYAQHLFVAVGTGPVDDQTTYPAQAVANNEGWNTTMPPVATGASTGLTTFGDANQIRTVALQCGAFALPEGSPDAAMLVTLSAQMTLQVSSVDGQTGNVLIEVYATAQ